jgi:hypothetical protein
MRHAPNRRAALSGLAGVVAAGVLAACGGSSPPPVVVSGSLAANRSAATVTGAPLALFTVALSGGGKPPGAAHGRGYAIIAVHQGSVVCWRFAHLHGFTIATGARIYAAAHPGSGPVSLSSGPRLHHRGCIRVHAGLAAALRARPGQWGVVVDSARFPSGAVRARL